MIREDGEMNPRQQDGRLFKTVVIEVNPVRGIVREHTFIDSEGDQHQVRVFDEPPGVLTVRNRRRSWWFAPGCWSLVEIEEVTSR